MEFPSFTAIKAAFEAVSPRIKAFLEVLFGWLSKISTSTVGYIEE